jgi:hypothetical protein
MLAFKRLVNVVVMVYLLLALLFILMPASRDFMMSSMGLSGDNLDVFYNTMFIIGAVLLALELIVENLYNVALKRDLSRQEGKVNELKARLYDHQMEQRDRDLQARPVTTAAPAAPTRPVTTTPPAVPVQPVTTAVPTPAPTQTPTTPTPAANTTTTTTRLDPVYVVPADPTPGTNLPPNTNVVDTPPHSSVPPASAASLETPRPTQYPSSQP